MPVKSYLIFPREGYESVLLESLSILPNCDVIPAANKKVFALVTDTPSNKAEEDLLAKLQLQDGLHHMNLISGFSTEAYE